MANPYKTILGIVSHLLKSHPEIAPAVEKMAVMAQGKSLQDIANYSEWKLYEGLTTKEVFTKIYQEGHWGKSPNPEKPFFSGIGSHDEKIVDVYIESVRSFIRSLGFKPSVVDLGCGDFNVGSKLVDMCQSYMGFDIVESLINFNKSIYKSPNITFKNVDITADELPAADLVIVRQVFQHLSNKSIEKCLQKILGSYKYLILTEHLPLSAKFTENLDKPTGRCIRLDIGSGVVLTSAPFLLRPKEELILSEAPERNGIIRTTLYRLG